MSETKFQAGDVCEAHGNKGKVIEVELFSPYVIVVMFDDGPIERYLPCGRLAKYHKEPSLKLIERPKKKVTKTMYQAIVQDVLHNGATFMISNFLFESEKGAREFYISGFIALGPAITFEVEE